MKRVAQIKGLVYNVNIELISKINMKIPGKTKINTTNNFIRKQLFCAMGCFIFANKLN